MGRFDVYPRPGIGRGGYVVDVQADILADLSTRIVIPLVAPPAAPKPARNLNPCFDIEGKPHVLLTQFIAAVPSRELRHPVVSLRHASTDIMRALDMLLVGF